MRPAAANYDETAQQRLVAEPPKRPGRTAFERDRARVLHSAALRRLAATTQVVVPGESDFPRTRLTHSLECGQVGRELGSTLGCDADLVEVACLAHDLGHPPFGHTGESALDAFAQPCGGFEGNAQSLRILTRLEAKTFTADDRPAGLNLTRASLDAATKYPWARAGEGPRAAKYGYYADDADVFDWVRQGAPEDRRCLEAQVMDWSDDVAYSVHDLEDGVHSGALPLAALHDADERRGLAELAAGTYVEASPAEAEAALQRLLALSYWPTEFDGTVRSLAGLKNLTSQLIGRFCESAERATREVAGAGPVSRFDADLVVPAGTRQECGVLKAATARFVMGTPQAHARYHRQLEIVRELADALLRRAPTGLDVVHREAWDEAVDDAARLRALVDQIASLTDRSAIALHGRLVGERSG